MRRVSSLSGLKAQVHVAHPVERLPEQARAHEQHEGGRDLGHDQGAPEPRCPASVAPRPPWRRASFTSLRAACSAGARPNRTPVREREDERARERPRVEGRVERER